MNAAAGLADVSEIPFFLPPPSDKKPLHARHELLYAALSAGSSPLTDKVKLSMRTTFKGGRDHPPFGPSAKESNAANVRIHVRLKLTIKPLNGSESHCSITKIQTVFFPP